MEARRVSVSEWRAVRDIRLRALADAPKAFGGNYDEAVLRPDSWWIDLAERSAAGDSQVLALAWEGSEAVGVAGAFKREDVFTVYSMRTDPGHRGKGVGRALLDLVVAFADEDEVTLSCTEGNDAARRLYERYGFVETGETEPLQSDPSLLVRHMRLQR